MPAHVMRFDKVLVLRAYASGFFPMGESADSPHIDWHNPAWRGVLPLDGFHVPKRLRRTVRSGRFEPLREALDRASLRRGEGRVRAAVQREVCAWLLPDPAWSHRGG